MNFKMWINGEWMDSASKQTRKIVDPATGETIATVPEANAADAKMAVQAARVAFDKGPWRSTSPQERSQFLLKVAAKVRQKEKLLSELETKNVGKPYFESVFDVSETADCFEYHAGLARKISGETLPGPGGFFNFVTKEPIGVCAQIAPWNYPLLIAAWKLAPALAAGNTIVFKPSELTPLTVLELAKIFEECGLPRGVVNFITGAGNLGQELVENTMVDKVSFTGGIISGRKVMTTAAATVKRISLELGGKNANIIFEDADLDAAIEASARGTFFNQGEVCAAISRLLVHKSVHKQVVEGVIARAKEIKIGNGLNEGTTMGPLISAAQREKVESYIEIGQKEGAKLVYGGKRPQGDEFKNGFFVEPTIFDQVKPNMRIAREEIFGPVMAIIPFSSEEEAIEITNDSEFGLCSGLWTRDLSRTHRVSKQIRAGTVWVNNYFGTGNDLPWGGYKQSGLGRELGTYGINEYMQVKQVTIKIE
jgi:betaine-aldehyde dehydrogenase